MGRHLLMKDHRVKYSESGFPLWFILLYQQKSQRIEIVIAEGETEEEVCQKLEGQGEILKVVQLWALLARARILAGFIRELG